MPINKLAIRVKNYFPRKLSLHGLPAFGIMFILSACSNPYTVSINNNAVFDPQDRLYTGEVRNADLQGCINFAMRQ